MRIRKDFAFTFIAYSYVRRHDAERALGITWYPWTNVIVTVWEWSWSIGFGHDDARSWYGPWLSYTKPLQDDGYWAIGLSDKLTWEQGV